MSASTSTPVHVDAGREAERAGRPLDARRHFEAALHALTGEDEVDLAAKLLRWIAWTHTTEGDTHAAFDCLEAAEAVATALQDDMALASVLNTRAGTYFTLGDLDQAEEIFDRARFLAVRIGARRLEAIAEQNLGNIASIRGDDDNALRRFQASLVHFEALGETAYVGPLLNNIGRLQTDLHDEGEAARTFARAREMCTIQGDRHHFIIVEVNRARLMLRAGDIVDALRTAEEAREAARVAGDDRWSGDILLVCGAAHLRLGSPELALELLDRAADIARTREDPKLMADVVLEQARGLRSLGRNRDTLRRLNEARSLFERLRARRDLASVGERLGELEAAFLRIVREWGESIESKDAYTQGHCSRVADYACLLAESAGLPAGEMMWFRMGALLHDVGKVSVPLEILTKPGRLDDSEWLVMARHPVFGVELLEGIEFPWDVRPMIRHHHERWDGSGYPDALAGEAIPLEARILTVADIYDALTTTRSYRAAFTHEKAMEILASEVERSVDPDLFALFSAAIAREQVPAGTTAEPVRHPVSRMGTTTTARRRRKAPPRVGARAHAR
jgi:putative nucleotidyltransferase with HDIG domain